MYIKHISFTAGFCNVEKIISLKGAFHLFLLIVMAFPILMGNSTSPAYAQSSSPSPSHPNPIGPIPPVVIMDDPIQTVIPSGLTAAGKGGNIALAWLPIAGATSYNVYQSTVAGGPYTIVSYLGSVSGSHYTDLNLTNGIIYYYVITGVNSSGESKYSNEAVAVSISVASGFPSADDATFISQSVPSSMTAGQTYNVTVTMGNAGTSTWVAGGRYQLASQNAAGNAVWNVSPDGSQGKSNSVAPSTTVGINSDIIFSFAVTAPTTPGAYNFQWQMANETSGSYQYFGEQTDNVVVTVGASVPTHLIPAQAIQIAQTFCNSNGNPISVPGNAQYAVPDPDNTYWQPRWTVTFDGQAVVQVVDATSTVASYTNDAYISYIASVHGQTVGPLSSQATAIQAATTILQATANTEQTSLPSAQLNQDNNGLDAGESTWSVLYNRQYQGIPYKDDFAVMQIDAATNQLVGLSLTYRCVPPNNGGSALIVTQDQANATAQAQISQSGIQAATLQSSTMEVVLPNTYWQDGNYNFTPGQGKVAWVVSYTIGDPTLGISTSVWVDAATGNIVGGEYVGEELSRHTKHKPAPVHKKKAKHLVQRVPKRHKTSKRTN